MLRNLGIRWQILSALALPVLVLGLISSQVTYQALLDMRDASQSRELAQAGSGFAVVINGLATERALSEEVILGLPGAQPQLKAGRVNVDRELATIRAQVYGGNSNNAAVQRVLARLAAVNALIPALRHDVDSGHAQSRPIAVRYSHIIDADVHVPFDLADTLTDQDQAANFRDAGELGIAIEALAQEQLTGVGAIATGRLSTLDQRDLGAAEATGAQALSDYTRAAPAGQRALLATALAAPAARTAELAKARTALQNAGTTQAPNLALIDWLATTNSQIKSLKAVFDRISSDGVALATADYNSARKKLQLTLAGAIGVTLLALAFALALSRRVAAPLRRLTLAATQIRDELPRLVESLQSDEDFELHLPVVSTVGRNEVSQLAAAFVDVNAVTVQIAREQARLRSAVGDMFVNVARRNQVLLARQLAFIDQLERNEVNPDALEELFRLDHLATRMRRNAESLLVLAGIESGRRLREPMPLSDVVRTATSEIEHYSRVSLSLAVDPPLFAHLALPVAHLLAELLENATNFSDPGSTVVVMATATEHGVRMTVADDGLGMSADELAEINARIDEPPTAEALSSQRLGFFVVGRLAQRLDAKVTLTSGRSRGTAVLIDLPAALFIPGGLDTPGYDQPAALSQPPQLAAQAQPVVPSQANAPRQSQFAARAPEPVAISAGSPFVDAYSTTSSTPIAAAPPIALATSIPPPSAPVIPASLNVEALVADAEAEPTWMPQPDALPFGSAPPVVADSTVPPTPLARRGATPAVAAPPLAVPPMLEADSPAASASEWAGSEWAEPSAPSWAASDWAVPEQARPAPAVVEPQPDLPVEAAAPAAGPSLFSGFRSRRETAAAPAESVVAGSVPVPVVAPEPIAPVAEFASPKTELEFAAVAHSDAGTTTDDEWHEAPPLSNPDSDRWQAWAEVSAANTGPESAGDATARATDQTDEYQPVAYHPTSYEAPAYQPLDYEPASSPETGYDQIDYHRTDYQTRSGQAGDDQAGYGQSGYAELGPAEPGYAQPGYGQPGYDQTGYEQGSYDQAGYDQAGYDQAGYDQAGYDQAGYDQAGYDQTGYAPAGHQADPGYPTELYVPEPEPVPYVLEPTGYAPEATETVEPEVARPATGGEIRMRTLTAAIDILPQRTSIRTALRRSRRKGDIPGAELPFTGGFDPIVVARDFARREGFSDSGAAGSLGQAEVQPEIPKQAGPEAEPAAERRQHQRRSPDDVADGTGARAALASEALTELSRLSSYSPTSMPASTAPSLQRRPPSEMPPEEAEPVVDDPAGPRTRTASSVRSMLAGFKAGVERGRTSPSANRPAGDRDSAALPQPRKSAGRDE